MRQNGQETEPLASKTHKRDTSGNWRRGWASRDCSQSIFLTTLTPFLVWGFWERNTREILEDWSVQLGRVLNGFQKTKMYFYPVQTSKIILSKYFRSFCDELLSTRDTKCYTILCLKMSFLLFLKMNDFSAFQSHGNFMRIYFSHNIEWLNFDHALTTCLFFKKWLTGGKLIYFFLYTITIATIRDMQQAQYSSKSARFIIQARKIEKTIEGCHAFSVNFFCLTVRKTSVILKIVLTPSPRAVPKQSVFV